MGKYSAMLLSGMIGVLSPLLIATSLLAEEVTRQGEITQEELEALWSDLYEDEPAAASAVLKLYKNADSAVPFLRAKLRPLRLDADRCRQLLKELGSADEAVWKAAWETLDYLDPRLAIGLETLMEEVVEEPARTRMVEICSQFQADSLAGKSVSIRKSSSGGFNFFDGRGSWWAEHQIERLDKQKLARKRAWVRMTRAVAVLEHIGSPEAVKLLEKVALGHPDASPTRAAEESLVRLNKK